MAQAEDDVKADAKRNVQRKEAEKDMCEEDRVFMAQRRAQVTPPPPLISTPSLVSTPPL